MNRRSRQTSGQWDRFFSRGVLVIGILLAGVLGYELSGMDRLEAVMIPGFMSIAVVGGVLGFTRLRTRGRWQAAWDAYAAQEGSRGRTGPYQDEKGLTMAATR